MLTQWKNKILQNATRIGASWLLAIGILLGAQTMLAIIASAHSGGAHMQMLPAAAGTKFVAVHGVSDGKLMYINPSFITSVFPGEFSGRQATLVWFGSEAYGVQESPVEILGDMLSEQDRLATNIDPVPVSPDYEEPLPSEETGETPLPSEETAETPLPSEE